MRTFTPDAVDVSVPVPPRSAGGPSLASRLWKLLAAALGLVCVAVLMQITEGARLLIALTVAGILFFLLKRAPSAGVNASLVFLAVMGGLRRWLIPVFDWTGTDPLLLTGAIAVTLYLVTTRRTVAPTRLSRLVLGLIGLMILEVVNPLQGGLIVGVTGLLFYVVPLMWYFAARQFASRDLMTKLFPCVIAIGTLSALYGLYQTYFGFNQGELAWLNITKEVYVAVGIQGVTRAFSWFTSAAEYSRFLAFSLVLLWVYVLRGNRLALLLMPLLGIALVLEAVRTSIVSALVACVILWAVQARNPQVWVMRLIPAALLVVGGGVWGLQHFQTDGPQNGTQVLVQHTVAGLVDPAHSTAAGHLDNFVGGIISGFTVPIGHGLGSTTIADEKFSDGQASGSTEYDVSNMFVSLGFIGGLIYTGVVVLVTGMALRLWRQTRSLTSLGVLGVLIAGFLQWLTGGEYATNTFIWVCIGVLDRFCIHRADSAVFQASPRPSLAEARMTP